MSKASERQKRFKEQQAELGIKQVTVLLSEATRKRLELLKSQMGVSSVSKVIDEIVTSNAEKFIQKAVLEQKIEERVLFHIHNEGSFRKAAIKLNEEGVPSSLGNVAWGHSGVSRFLKRIGMDER
ncbi:MAG: hypothetical protein HQL72_14870 [Magnetococcales bacterium]|nr:hypothetical protein [Magnetococcales bacterium]